MCGRDDRCFSRRQSVLNIAMNECVDGTPLNDRAIDFRDDTTIVSWVNDPRSPKFLPWTWVCVWCVSFSGPCGGCACHAILNKVFVAMHHTMVSINP